MYSIAIALFLSLVSASPIERRAAPTYKFNGDAPFTVSSETLAASLTCPRGNPTAAKPPVLLVHGTVSTGASSWDKGYVPALAANGYTPCYVTLPNLGMDDMQIASEYVAYNIHYLSSLSGGLKPAIISHSQGGPVSQWALQFWPSTRTVARAFIPLAPDFDGVDLAISEASAICDLINCQPSLWQQSQGSNYYKALHAKNFRALVPTTSIWSAADGVVTPPERNAKLPGATVIAAEQLCPLRFVTHIYTTIDSAVFALTLDALNNNGIASVSRVSPKRLSVCPRIQAEGMDLAQALDLKELFEDLVKGVILGKPRVAKEPAVKAYAL